MNLICFVENLRTPLRKIHGHVLPGINGYFYIRKPLHFNGNLYFYILMGMHISMRCPMILNKIDKYIKCDFEKNA